jgi:hypothetical protein
MACWIADHPHCNAETVPKRPCALLWDESFLWGVMAWRALKAAGLSFDLLRSEDIRQGALSRYRMIFVPGGWASNKIDALGERGLERIRCFVAAGGGYLGICGGGGMATKKGLGLLSIQRRPSSERVPSFSGRIRLSLTAHVIWQDVETPVFWAWWPSQFRWYWRNPLLLQWRRGVRGLEYSTLAVMIGEIAGRLGKPAASGPEGRPALPELLDPSCLQENLEEIRGLLLPFCEKAKRLLVLERFNMMSAPLSPMVCEDAEIGRLRRELFASEMSHGGDFKRLIDSVDRLLYSLIREE